MHNPELPPELLDQPEDVVHGDQIGETMFSKHWVFTTLMKLIEVLSKNHLSLCKKFVNHYVIYSLIDIIINTV